MKLLTWRLLVYCIWICIWIKNVTDFVVYDILYYIHLTDFSQWIEKWTLTPSTFSNCIAPISLFLGKNMEYQFSLFMQWNSLKIFKICILTWFFPREWNMYKKNENFAVIVVKYEWTTPKVIQGKNLIFRITIYI